MKKKIWEKAGNYYCNGRLMNGCKVCGHLWMKRTKNPKRCPKCQSIKWATGQSYRSYGLGDLSVGESKIIKWNMKDGIPDEFKNKQMNRAIDMYAKRHGKKFARQGSSQGLILTRFK